MTLSVGGLRGWYGRAQVLFGVDLAVGPGEAVGLLGRNGAGKSTCLKAIAGLLDRCEGDVRLDGAPLSGRPPHVVARAGVAYVPEDRRIFTELTVTENLAVGRQGPREGAPRWTPERLFALFPSLGAMRDRRGGAMSGGEQQMLTIARALMGNPRVLLLDEPSEGLAPRVVEEVARAVAALKREGLCLLMSEQNLPFARVVTDRVVVLDRGRSAFAGSFAALDADPALTGALLAV